MIEDPVAKLEAAKWIKAKNRSPGNEYWYHEETKKVSCKPPTITKAEWEQMGTKTQNAGIVKVVRYDKNDRFKFAKQWLAVTSQDYDLVIALEPMISPLMLQRLNISGRYSSYTPLDLQCKSMFDYVEKFIHKTQLSQFGDAEKEFCRDLIAEIIFVMRTIDNPVFESILTELKQTNEHREFNRVASLGYNLMKKMDQFTPLKMIKIERMDDEMVNVMLSFAEISIKKMLASQLDEMRQSFTDSNFAKAQEFKRLYEYGEVHQERHVGTSKLFEILRCSIANELGVSERKKMTKRIRNVMVVLKQVSNIKPLWTIGRILHERKEKSDTLRVYVAVDSEWDWDGIGCALMEYVDAIGYKNSDLVGIPA